MLFYTSVFLISMVFSFIVIWMFRTIVGATKVVWFAMLPGARDTLNSHTEKKNDSRIPWGWLGREKSSAVARAHPAAPVADVPWGWPGNGAKVRRQSRPVASGGDLDSYLRGQIVEQATASKTARVKAGRLNIAAPWGW